MVHHKRKRIRGRSPKRKRHRKAKRVRVGAKHLYVIGNGFDIHHHIPSSYKDFREWLEENDSDTFNKVEEILNDGGIEWWNEFETSLGKPFAVKQYVENVALENQPNYASDSYRDRDLYAAEFETERELGELVNDLKSDFQEWASQLPTGDGEMMVKLQTKNSVFLNFNYTLTLENRYGIPRDRVTYIHGIALDKESIIFGHGRDYGSYRSDLEDKLPVPPNNLSPEDYEQWLEDVTNWYSDDYPTTQAKDAAASAISKMQKNVTAIISANWFFFKSLESVKVIHIYGFSFADVDLPYLWEIIKNIKMENTEWEISYYSEKDKLKAKDFLGRLKTTPKNVSHIKLEDIRKYRQLTFSF